MQTKEWRLASSEEINNMTFNEAKEIIKRMINLGHKSGDFRPREHFTKAMEIILEKAEANNKKTYKKGVVGTHIGTQILIDNECDGCIHYDDCGYFEFCNNDLTEEERFTEYCVGCCCGDGYECNKNNGCWNYEDGSEPLLG